MLAVTTQCSTAISHGESQQSFEHIVTIALTIQANQLLSKYLYYRRLIVFQQILGKRIVKLLDLHKKKIKKNQIIHVKSVIENSKSIDNTAEDALDNTECNKFL